ncbi:HAD family hydrolase [Thermoflavimicrobium dichotomicum]|uniref:Haloacid dehalogenase superfamily, subfamily IA, variant 3 with third motif having DD or ED/haloacid dehalogenase superfamily, subfamily IA, variant 1 with third motif having Dx(3-4)D or Dx(3-4)E n=1 Tax=Thermoflavimicrobium dichotomicum TaxID=46223 RepID=A0A1I3LI58_9BACL|nr:HAD family hydrolase [Thermoflavimicrobium dichotomicum]SFI84250.1 haloacid dehalogenase superfamily, subfamily IA, variant 3 with third motif having DD or ED/haloacid dehalogenase superfamily, subfamily IA, variant 1 with third motif having Dx(3-4)D or Dx(3-4)E [Thermoflavimicrobium dichotomicum]
MIKALLFDLDGTLLPMDTEQFVDQYTKALAPEMAHVIPPEKFVKMLFKATAAMIENKEKEKTNKEVFEQAFSKESGVAWERIADDVDRFYRDTFPTLKEHAGFEPLARQVVQAAMDQGYKVVVATNPVFPKAAILERLRWAGIHDFPFAWVTVYEETHFCKPHPEYYLEIVERIGVKPNECVMIGNDMQEDMVASTLGMKTFWVTTNRIDRGKPVYRVDQEGSLADLLAAIREQTGIFCSV